MLLGGWSSATDSGAFSASSSWYAQKYHYPVSTSLTHPVPTVVPGPAICTAWLSTTRRRMAHAPP
eukprot:1776504-Rhodomonas_salina.1